MRCPKCGHLDDKVVDSRLIRAEAAIRRRRQCLSCDHRFTTHEQIIRDEIRVVKRDGRREPFSREKLEGGLLRACEKRPVTTEAIHALVDDVLSQIEQEGETDIPTEHIGTAVMDRLLQLDDVAYIRFASVYWRFDDLNQFVNTVRQMTRKRK